MCVGGSGAGAARGVRAGIWPGVLAGLLLGPAGASGWGARTHRWIAYQAMAGMADRLPHPPDRVWRLVARGAVDPDRRSPGQIPAWGHVYHVLPGPDGVHRGDGPRVLEGLTGRASRRGAPWRERYYELGRICHIVSDLCQPQHTAGRERNPREPGEHRAFEALVDAWIDEIEPGEPLRPTSREPGPMARELAGGAFPWYDSLGGLLRDSGGEAALEGLVRERLAASVGATLALWDSVLAETVRARWRPDPVLVLAGWLALIGVYLACMPGRRPVPRTGALPRQPAGEPSPGSVPGPGTGPAARERGRHGKLAKDRGDRPPARPGPEDLDRDACYRELFGRPRRPPAGRRPTAGRRSR